MHWHLNSINSMYQKQVPPIDSNQNQQIVLEDEDVILVTSDESILIAIDDDPSEIQRIVAHSKLNEFCAETNIMDIITKEHHRIPMTSPITNSKMSAMLNMYYEKRLDLKNWYKCGLKNLIMKKCICKRVITKNAKLQCHIVQLKNAKTQCESLPSSDLGIQCELPLNEKEMNVDTFQEKYMDTDPHFAVPLAPETYKEKNSQSTQSSQPLFDQIEVVQMSQLNDGSGPESIPCNQMDPLIGTISPHKTIYENIRSLPHMSVSLQKHCKKKYLFELCSFLIISFCSSNLSHENFCHIRFA